MKRGYLDRPDCRIYYEVTGEGPLLVFRAWARRQSFELVAAGAAFPRPLCLLDLRTSRFLASSVPPGVRTRTTMPAI